MDLGDPPPPGPVPYEMQHHRRAPPPTGCAAPPGRAPRPCPGPPAVRGRRAAALACTVPQPPSWPVFRRGQQVGRPRRPRTSPTTSRSGPHPQRLPHQVLQRHPARRPPGWRAAPPAAPHADGRGAAPPSPRRARSARPARPGPAARSAESSCREPVPPLIRNDSRASSSARSSRSPPGGTVPAATSSSSVKARGRTTRRDRQVEPTATGGSTACSRVPSGSRASTQGRASSSRRPATAASRCARRAYGRRVREAHVRAAPGRRPGPPTPGRAR